MLGLPWECEGFGFSFSVAVQSWRTECAASRLDAVKQSGAATQRAHRAHEGLAPPYSALGGAGGYALDALGWAGARGCPAEGDLAPRRRGSGGSSRWAHRWWSCLDSNSNGGHLFPSPRYQSTYYWGDGCVCFCSLFAAAFVLQPLRCSLSAAAVMLLPMCPSPVTNQGAIGAMAASASAASFLQPWCCSLRASLQRPVADTRARLRQHARGEPGSLSVRGAGASLPRAWCWPMCCSLCTAAYPQQPRRCLCSAASVLQFVCCRPRYQAKGCWGPGRVTNAAAMGCCISLSFLVTYSHRTACALCRVSCWELGLGAVNHQRGVDVLTGASRVTHLLVLCENEGLLPEVLHPGPMAPHPASAGTAPPLCVRPGWGRGTGRGVVPPRPARDMSNRIQRVWWGWTRASAPVHPDLPVRTGRDVWWVPSTDGPGGRRDVRGVSGTAQLHPFSCVRCPRIVACFCGSHANAHCSITAILSNRQPLAPLYAPLPCPPLPQPPPRAPAPPPPPASPSSRPSPPPSTLHRHDVQFHQLELQHVHIDPMEVVGPGRRRGRGPGLLDANPLRRD